MDSLMTSLRGFTFNGKHNTEMNAVMHSKSIQPPPKKKIKESVPFMHGSYDFSTVGSNGEIVYSEREITIILGLPSNTKEKLQTLYSSVLEWLEDTPRQELRFDVIKDYYYLAEVEEVSSFAELMSFGTLTVKFTAYPFKLSIDYVGDDIWDTFNFEEDIVQSNEFDVVGTKNITLYNPGRLITPIINCSSAMTLIKGSKSYNLLVGNNRPYSFKLDSLYNNITINGTGRIHFMFRKEKI